MRVFIDRLATNLPINDVYDDRLLWWRLARFLEALKVEPHDS